MSSHPVSRFDSAVSAFRRAHAELLASLVELDETGAWQGDGASSLAAWAAGRADETFATAREWVENALALRDREPLEEAFRDGLLSAEQMKALCVLAEPGDEDRWLRTLPYRGVCELRRKARKERARKLERRDGGRYLRLAHTSDERFMRISGQLHPEEGALLMRAIDRGVPDDTPYEGIDRARVDGLMALARVAVSSDADPDRATIVLHVTDEVGELENGGFVPFETWLRLACDSRVETVVHDLEGNPIGIGRASRNVPAHMYRELRRRDGCCVFPDCERARFLHAHHLVHWAKGGPTDLANLVLLCLDHHQLVHEDGWTITGPAGPDITWIKPDGTPYRAREPAMAGA